LDGVKDIEIDKLLRRQSLDQVLELSQAEVLLVGYRLPAQG